MSGLREKNKEDRRRKIIMAATRLIKKSKSTAFTMVELSKSAGVSTFTTYNLIGSKALVLYILLNKLLDEIETPEKPASPSRQEAVAHFFDVIDKPLQFYAEQEDLYRPLIRYLFGSDEKLERQKYQARAWDFWRRAVSVLQQAGFFHDDLQADDFVRAFNVSFTGCIELWVHGEVTAPSLRAHARSALAMLLLGLENDDCREMLLSIIRQARPMIDGKSE